MLYDLIMISSSDSEDLILEIRFNELKDLDCKHVILESEYSHSGIYKGFHFNTDRFKDFKDKILYFQYSIPLSEVKRLNNMHLVEMQYRDTLFELIKDRLNPEDIIFNSDNDEIPKYEVLKDILKKDLRKPITLFGEYFMLTLDLWGRKSFDGFLIKSDWAFQRPLRFFRSHRTNFQDKNGFDIIDNASNHYSSVGSVKDIFNKFKYFCHANEFDIKDENFIRECIINKRGDFKNNDTLKLIELTEKNTPKYVLNNIDKFRHLMYSNYI